MSGDVHQPITRVLPSDAVLLSTPFADACSYSPLQGILLGQHPGAVGHCWHGAVY